MHGELSESHAMSHDVDPDGRPAPHRSGRRPEEPGPSAKTAAGTPADRGLICETLAALCTLRQIVTDAGPKPRNTAEAEAAFEAIRWRAAESADRLNTALTAAGENRTPPSAAYALSMIRRMSGRDHVLVEAEDGERWWEAAGPLPAAAIDDTRGVLAATEEQARRVLARVDALAGGCEAAARRIEAAAARVERRTRGGAED